jgi:hypothetical protein
MPSFTLQPLKNHRVSRPLPGAEGTSDISAHRHEIFSRVGHMTISEIVTATAAVVLLLCVSAVGQQDPVLVGAGDIASCDDLRGAEATAKLIEKIPGTVFAGRSSLSRWF